MSPTWHPRRKVRVPQGTLKRKCRFAITLGVDTALFQPSDVDSGRQDYGTGDYTIGYCGRFDEEKGLTALIEAVASIHESGSHKPVLRLLGGSVSKRSLNEYLAEKQQKYKWLTVLPSVPHDKVPGFLQTLDIFVLPARIVFDHQEHDAHALMEAMACGVACIGTTSGIIPEILDGEHGRLLPPSDPQSLAAELIQLMNDQKTRFQLANNARKKAEAEFSLDVVARCRMRAYNRTM